MDMVYGLAKMKSTGCNQKCVCFIINRRRHLFLLNSIHSSSSSSSSSIMVVSTILSVASLQGIINTLQALPLFAYLFSFIKDLVVAVLKTGPIPRHVALIMDGNRTYAKRNQLALKDGHSAGAESLLLVRIDLVNIFCC